MILFRKTILLFLLAITGLSLNAQTPFLASYQNPGYFGGYSRLLPTPDGGYIALSGAWEKVVVKFDAFMNVEWSNQMVLSGGQFDYGVHDLILSNDGNIMLLAFGGASLSETYLIAAEAAVKGASTQAGYSARQLVNIIRARAGMPETERRHGSRSFPPRDTPLCRHARCNHRIPQDGRHHA